MRLRVPACRQTLIYAHACCVMRAAMTPLCLKSSELGDARRAGGAMTASMSMCTFLRAGQPAAKLKKQWEKDAPLPLALGGTMAPLSFGAEEKETRAKTLHSGAKVTSLCCLTMLGHEMSLPSIGVDENQVEALGRRFFTKSVAPVSGVGPEGQGGETPSQEAPDIGLGKADGDAQSFWGQCRVHFPSSWPDKCVIPISVSDPNAITPGRLRILCMDEMVLAFWKFVGYAQHLLVMAESEENKDKTKQNAAKVASRKAVVEAARRLQRNVPFTLIYCENEQARYVEALSLREDVESLREHIALTGWQRCVIAGSKRDELRTSLRRNVRAEEVAQALARVRWSAGREMGSDVAEKLIVVYDKCAGQQSIIECISQGQHRLGKRSPFDEWTKLLIIVQRTVSVDDTVWVMQYMIHDQATAKTDSFSKAELLKKHGPIMVYLLRKRVLEGLAAAFIAPAQQVAKQMSSNNPGLTSTGEHLAEFHKRFESVQKYMEATHQANSAVGQFLPSWCGVTLARLMRHVFEGVKDKLLVAVLLKPPKGGFPAIKYDHLCKLDGFQQPIDEIAKLYGAWASSVSSEEEQPHVSVQDHDSSGGLGGGEAPSKDGGESANMPLVKKEISQMAEDSRVAYVGIAPVGGSVLATVQLIQASSTYQLTNQKHMCYLYTVPCSWDLPQEQGREAARRARPVRLIPEDFANFCEVVDRLVSASNESYAVVLVGKSTRQGSGLMVEAGLLSENMIVSTMRDKTKISGMRVKRFRLQYEGFAGTYKRGISGVISETMFFFYRGSWPSKRTPATRGEFGGSTWDDCWNNVPIMEDLAPFVVPYDLKQCVFEEHSRYPNIIYVADFGCFGHVSGPAPSSNTCFA